MGSVGQWVGWVVGILGDLDQDSLDMYMYTELTHPERLVSLDSMYMNTESQVKAGL